MAARQNQRQLAQQISLQREATASLFDKKTAGEFVRHIKEMIDG